MPLRALATGIAVFIAVYAVSTPITGVIVKKDIDKLSRISSGIGAVSEAAGLVLDFGKDVETLHAEKKRQIRLIT